MVHGLEKFKEYFKDHTNQYVFIGGTACDIIMDELGAQFRATKDLDMVLIIEALDKSFGETFWKFIEDGGYKNRQKSKGDSQFYRFTKPSDPSFPKMIELFSRSPIDFELKFETGLTPIHVDSKNIKKHKNDVFRLLTNVTPSVKINTEIEVVNDVNKFIELIEEDKPDIKNLGIKGTDYYELIEILKNIYLKK